MDSFGNFPEVINLEASDFAFSSIVASFLRSFTMRFL